MAYHPDGTTCSFAEEYEKDVLALEKELNKLQAENKKLRKGLEFYAKETNWKLNKINHAPLFSKCENDLGDIAREALKEVDKL